MRGHSFLSVLLTMLVILAYGVTAAVLAGGDSQEGSAGGVARLVIYLTLVVGNATALSGFVVLYLRRKRRTGKQTTNRFVALAVYRELAGLMLAMGLVGVALNRYIPIIPDISEHAVYFLIGVSAVTVLLRGTAFIVEFRRPGYLEEETYLWPWTALAERFCRRRD